MLLYRVLPEEDVRSATREGAFRGSTHDVRDGFIHLSAAHQVEGTLAKHYARTPGLTLLVIDGDALANSPGCRLEWEVSRGGDRFPHLYGALPMSVLKRTFPLSLDADGVHVLPPLG